MNILYLSCHSILEFDELTLFNELGINFFSLGSYVNPNTPVDPIRPAIKYNPDPWLLEHVPDRDKLPPEFVEKFDAIIVMHVPEWIVANWDVIKHKLVIWRTIGQSTPKTEAMLRPYRQQGLKVVRYSPREIGIAQNIGADAVIRFYKDPNEFNHWVGAGNEVITFAQNMAHRGEFCNWDAFKYLAQGFNAKVYGTTNEKAGELNGGFLTYAEMKQKMRDARVFVYTGTQPACYTLAFIEAMMTGAPIVAVGGKYGNSLNIAGDMYEIPDIIQDGVNGYVSDDLEYLRDRIDMLTKSVKIARRIGEMGRQTAIQLFGKENIKEQWRGFIYDHHRKSASHIAPTANQ